MDEPPPAALDVVECCGRLPLVLPIAGRMMRELADKWHAKLVPMLKAELSGESSVEKQVVDALSLIHI